jgi:hypothetical protein
MSLFAVSGNRSIAAIALLLAAAGGTAGIAAATAQKSPLRCEIRTIRQGDMMTLQGVVLSDTAVNGTYAFTVEGSGRSGASSIRQGGAFSAMAGSSSTAGTVSLGARGAYDVNFEARAGGAKASCTQVIGG